MTRTEDAVGECDSSKITLTVRNFAGAARCCSSHSCALDVIPPWPVEKVHCHGLLFAPNDCRVCLLLQYLL